MTVDPELFRSHGVEPLYCKIVVVKSPNGFRAAHEPIAKRIILVDTPGVSTARRLLGGQHGVGSRDHVRWLLSVCVRLYIPSQLWSIII
jgi:MlrC C-terminus